ncbi:MAG: glycosyltransferase family 4 protein, partial [Myxococcales bacterium]|nr:glycosyltransferase family 4 protein [Myxococcales bacterium]
KADAVITCNPREAELLTRKLPARRVVRMPHGIPTEQFSVDQRASVFDAWPALRDRNLVLCVGRIDAVKNQRFLVERYAALRASLPNTVLVLAGGETDAAYARSLHELVRKEGLDDVVFTGGLAPRDPRLIGLYQAASVFVLPSLTETFGIVVLEAWAAKTPVLTTATSGTRQLVEHGANGFFFDLEDPASFDAPLRQLLTDRNLAHRVAERGERLVREQYDTTQVAGRFKALYEEISARHLP